MKSKLLILLAAGALMLVMTVTAAFADNLLCQVGIACNGTPKGDILTGTSSSDQIKGFGGRDRINDNFGNDVDTISPAGRRTTPSTSRKATPVRTTATSSIAARASGTGSSSTRAATATGS